MRLNQLMLPMVAGIISLTVTLVAPAADVQFGEPLNPKMLEQATKTHVYQLVPSKLNETSLDSLSAKLVGAQSKPQNVKAGQLVGRSFPDLPSHFVILDPRNGFLSFNRGMAQVIDDQPGKLPAQAEAVKIAADYLAKMGLAPANSKEMVVGHVSRVKSASFDPKTEKAGPVREQMLTVHFARQIDNVRVVGSGSKVIVRIGDGGNVVGGAVRWRELGKATPLKAEQLRPIAQIQKDINEFLNRELNKMQSIKVVSTGLCYYDRGGQYIQPVIGYEAVIGSGKLAERYFGQTALLVQPPERVGPEVSRPEARRNIRMGTRDLKPPTPGEDDGDI